MLDDAADGQTVGCCALINLGGGGTYEVAKMAVAESHHRRGYGELLLRAMIDRARALGARRLFIRSRRREARNAEEDGGKKAHWREARVDWRHRSAAPTCGP